MSGNLDTGRWPGRSHLAPLKECLSNPDLSEALPELLASVRAAEEQSAVAVARRSYKRVPTLSEAQVEDLVATYRAGATVQGLARQFAVHRTTVMAVLDRQQVQRRVQGRVLSGEEIERACQLYHDGLNLRAVGAELGADYRVVRRGLLAAGVRLRRAGR